MTVCDPKPREIHKASVEDRIVHHAIVRVIEPFFDQGFVFDSWSCRRGKGTTAAVIRGHRLLERASHNGKRKLWVLKCDIRKCFGSLDHDVLSFLIACRISDPQTVHLIAGIIESFSPGVPLGNLTSQLFANIYLDPLDHYIKEQLRSALYLRYSDDFLIASTNRVQLQNYLNSIRLFVQHSLRIELHPRKCLIRPYQHGIDWLGHVLYPWYRVLRPTTRKRIWSNIDSTVMGFLDGVRTRNRFQAVCASYAGLLKTGWNRSDLRRLMDIWVEF